jgi:hypothetical protein
MVQLWCDDGLTGARTRARKRAQLISVPAQLVDLRLADPDKSHRLGQIADLCLVTPPTPGFSDHRDPRFFRHKRRQPTRAHDQLLQRPQLRGDRSVVPYVFHSEASMKSYLWFTTILAVMATPALAETTTTTSPTLSTPGATSGQGAQTLSHDGSSSLTNSNAADASKAPGAGASPHTGYSAGMTPKAGTGSGTADGTTDTGATSPGSGKSPTTR